MYKFVADATGDKVDKWRGSPEFSKVFYNMSYAGVFNTHASDNHQYPSPNLHMPGRRSHRSILPAILDTWKKSDLPSYYEESIKVPDGLNPPKGYAP